MKHFPLPRPETSRGHTALMARQSPRARNPLRDNVFYDKQIQTLIIPLQTLLLIKHLFCDLLLFSLSSSKFKFCWLKMKLTSTINVLKISKLSLTNRLYPVVWPLTFLLHNLLQTAGTEYRRCNIFFLKCNLLQRCLSIHSVLNFNEEIKVNNVSSF